MLIANRGEIAVRIARACRELDIPSVAVFSEADRSALHVRCADEAYPCGPAAAAQSYLNGARLIEIARACGANAVHPGYGFLSENAAFARACGDAGLVFIGPEPETIDAMGDKVTSRRLMRDAGVPIVPGSTERLSDAEAVAFARELGLPVMVKASAGGGGKGLRLVRDEAQLLPSIRRARSEAKSSFGDDSIYVEKLVSKPRHVEIQILGDAHGNLVHLFERECSVQRRHQKLIEEAPANRVTPELRERMGRAAIAAARAVGYRGAGTVEFLLDGEQAFHFLEMNTRVQVEHPVTELITGIDIVKTGIRIAAGEPIGFAQADVGIHGWAIECRIYAEDPDRGFLPSPGRVLAFEAPGGPGVRCDSGVASGCEISVHYDPMIAKLVCWGRDRDEAIARMKRALGEFSIRGVKTSVPFHLRVLANERFVSGNYDTGFIEAEMAAPKAAPAADPELEAVARLVAELARSPERREGSFEIAVGSGQIRVELAPLGPGCWSALLEGRHYACSIDPGAKGKLEVRVGAHSFVLPAAGAE